MPLISLLVAPFRICTSSSTYVSQVGLASIFVRCCSYFCRLPITKLKMHLPSWNVLSVLLALIGSTSSSQTTRVASRTTFNGIEGLKGSIEASSPAARSINTTELITKRVGINAKKNFDIDFTLSSQVLFDGYVQIKRVAALSLVVVVDRVSQKLASDLSSGTASHCRVHKLLQSRKHHSNASR